MTGFFHRPQASFHTEMVNINDYGYDDESSDVDDDANDNANAKKTDPA